MDKVVTEIGLQYFTSQEYLINQQLNSWLPSLQRIGASAVVFSAGFDFAVPEDVIQCAINNQLKPVVHFTTILPTAQHFGEVSYLFDLYAKWGVESVILGDKPNIRDSWGMGEWRHENLINQFLNRFVSLAQHSIEVGLIPVFPPLQPGGEFWDTAFLELALEGLKQRQVWRVLDDLVLSSYGYTFNKPLTWGRGGPERWSISKPYSTPEGQEDQLGFHNFEWMEAISQKVTRENLPVMILDAGSPGKGNLDNYLESVQKILNACQNRQSNEVIGDDLITMNESVSLCAFSLDTLDKCHGGKLDISTLEKIFGQRSVQEKMDMPQASNAKFIHHYLLLPKHESGVSDVVLNKVRPFIKKYQPTIGFSLEEASLAEKVSIFPDPLLFTTTEVNRLRSAGCVVQVLPESGIDIATSLQET